MKQRNYTPKEHDQGRLMQILRSSILSEKTTQIQSTANGYGFRVLQDATKPEIRAAVELLFDVQVEKVSVVNIKGKAKRFGRFSGRRNHVRKAYVKLKEGQTINLVGQQGA